MPSSISQTGRTPGVPRARQASRSPSFLDDSDATLVLREDGIIDYVSASARRLLDLSSRSLTGDSFFRRIPSEAVARVARTLLDLSGREDGRATGLLQLKTGLGPWQWFKVEMTPRRQHEDEAGVVLHLHERGRR